MEGPRPVESIAECEAFESSENEGGLPCLYALEQHEIFGGMLHEVAARGWVRLVKSICESIGFLSKAASHNFSLIQRWVRQGVRKFLRWQWLGGATYCTSEGGLSDRHPELLTR